MERPPRAASVPPFGRIAVAFAASRLALGFIGWVAFLRIPGGRPSQPWPMPDVPLLFSMWVRYDSQWYLQIAAHGYHAPNTRYSPQAFFPLYPLLIGTTERLTGIPGAIAGVLWSNLLFLAALWLLSRLVARLAGAGTAWRTTWYLILFPTSFFFSAVYTEALFLAAVAAAFLAAHHRRWWPAALAGAAATLTRNLGITLLLPLGWMAFEQWRAGRQAGARHPGQASMRELWRQLAPLLLLPAALVAWMGFLWLTTGDPLRWVRAESAWGRRLMPPWTGLIGAAQRLATPPPPPPAAWQPGCFVTAWHHQFAPLYSLIDAGAALTWLALAAAGRRQGLGWPLVWFMLVGTLVPMMAPTLRSMTPLASMSRYVAVLFPGFIVMARAAERHPWLDTAITAAFPAVQAVFFVLFTTWNWIA